MPIECTAVLRRSRKDLSTGYFIECDKNCTISVQTDDNEKAGRYDIVVDVLVDGDQRYQSVMGLTVIPKIEHAIELPPFSITAGEGGDYSLSGAVNSNADESVSISLDALVQENTIDISMLNRIVRSMSVNLGDAARFATYDESTRTISVTEGAVTAEDAGVYEILCTIVEWDGTVTEYRVLLWVLPAQADE